MKPADIAHGTYGGAQAERGLDLPVCERCRRAHNAYIRLWRTRGRCASGLGWPLVGNLELRLAGRE